MFYINKNAYNEDFKELTNREPTEYRIEKGGYTVIHNACSRGELITSEVSTDEHYGIKFVVIFRSERSNLVALKDNSFAIPVESENIPYGATLDDLILLHGKYFIDNYTNTSSIEEFIINTSIQPWGALHLDNTLYIPIELIVKDEILTNGIASLNGDFTNDDRLKDDKNLPNGFMPIPRVTQYVKAFKEDNDVDKHLVINLKVVSPNE